MYWLNIWDSIKLYKKYNFTYKFLNELLYYFFIENLYYYCIYNKIKSFKFKLKYTAEEFRIPKEHGDFVKKLYIGKIVFFKYQAWNVILINYFTTNRRFVSYKSKIRLRWKFIFKKILNKNVYSLYNNNNYKYKFKLIDNNDNINNIQFNNHILNNSISYINIKNYMSGWKYFTKNFLDKRLELCHSEDKVFSDNDDWFIFIEVLYSIFFNFYNPLNDQKYNIMFLDFINSYKGLRHLKRLPVRGQRTWTNAWSSYRCNTLISSWKIESAKKFYGNYSNNILNVLYLSEHINYLWRIQWKNEWFSAKFKRVDMLKKKKRIIFKIDIISTSKGFLGIHQKNKVISKKKKNQMKKNTFTIGFSYKYTKLFLQYQNQPEFERKFRMKLLLEEEVVRNKNIKKKKKIEIKKKKEKKSIWD